MNKKSFYIFISFFVGAFFIAKSGDLDSLSNNKINKAISVDGTYLLTLLFKTEEPRITPFNFELSVLKNVNLRTGFNLDYSTSSNKGLNLDFKIGIEKLKSFSPKWRYNYGVDINGTYINYNDRPNTTSIISTLPFFGFEYFITKQLSLTYEPKLIYSFIEYKDPNSFIEKISYENEFRLTGLSQFYINFNF